MTLFALGFQILERVSVGSIEAFANFGHLLPSNIITFFGNSLCTTLYKVFLYTLNNYIKAVLMVFLPIVAVKIQCPIQKLQFLGRKKLMTQILKTLICVDG